MTGRLVALGAAFGLLCACHTPFGFGGEDWGGDTARNVQPQTDSGVDTTPGGAWGPSVVASHATCTDLAGAGLFVDVSGSQAWVTHDGFGDGCCADWQVDVTPDSTDPTHLTATYTNAATATCDCDCGGWQIEYVIDGLSDGSYRLTAGAQSVNFSVDTTAP